MAEGSMTSGSRVVNKPKFSFWFVNKWGIMSTNMAEGTINYRAHGVNKLLPYKQMT